jgi:hypothetical protein
MDEILERYAAECERLHKNPATVVESSWRGLLASFAYELAAYTEAQEEAA